MIIYQLFVLSRADASSGAKRRTYKYLDDAQCLVFKFYTCSYIVLLAFYAVKPLIVWQCVCKVSIVTLWAYIYYKCKHETRFYLHL